MPIPAEWTLKGSFVVLGIDAGFVAPGYCRIHIELENWQMSVVEAGCIQTQATSAKNRKKDRVRKSADDARRIEVIANAFSELIDRGEPDVCAIELPTAGAKNAGAIRGMAYATATATAVMAVRKVKVYYLSPADSKLNSTSERNASKMAMVESVRRQFPNFPWVLRTKGPRRTRGTLDPVQAYAMADAAAAALTFISSLPVLD